MNSETKRDFDDRVQQAVDRITARRNGLNVEQVRTALAAALEHEGASLPHDDLYAWARAITEGEHILVRTAMR